MRVPGTQCKITGPERAAIGWHARVDYAWSLHTVCGIVNEVTVWGLTRQRCERRASRAVARFHAEEGPPPRPWTKEEVDAMLLPKIGGLSPAEPAEP